MSSILTFLFGLFLFIAASYFRLRIYLPKKAEENKFVTSMKLGRIKAIVRAGRIVGYLANLPEGFDIDEETGRVVTLGKDASGKFIPVNSGVKNANFKSLAWKLFGVRMIWFDSVYEFKIQTYVERGENLEKITETATSLYFQGSYLDQISGHETLDGQQVGMRFRVTLQTCHAALTLKDKSFLERILDAVKSALREFIQAREIDELLAVKYEGSLLDLGTSSDFMDLIKLLNTTGAGNPGIMDTLGQEIIGINVLDIMPTPEYLAVYKAKKMASKNGEAEIEKSRLNIEVQTNNAKAVTEEAKGRAAAIHEVTDAEVKRLKDLAAAVGSPEAAAQIEVARHLSGFQGTTLVLGNGVNLAIPTPSKGGTP